MEMFKGQTAVISGGSRGIGRAIALSLAKEGANVVINYRGNRDMAEKTKTDCASYGVQAKCIQADISNPEEAERLIREALTVSGTIDILVNNAGITRDALMMRMKTEDLDAVLSTNLYGAFYCTKAALRPMLKQRHGRIISVSSVVGLHGNVGQANYAAAKAGMIGMTKSLAKEVASRNITVNVVAPGMIETEMTAAMTAAAHEAMEASIPMGRMGRPEEIADAVRFLASPSAGYITGQVLVVDGGLVC